MSAKHGRRAKSASGPSEPSMPQGTAFRLALKPPDNPDDFQPSVQMLSSEYASKYLESIGVKPCKSTVELVHKNVPLTNNCIKTTFRKKGHVNDEILLTVPPVNHHPKVPPVIGAHAVFQLGTCNVESGSRAASSEEQAAQSSSSSSAPAKEAPKGQGLLDLASRYLHPFTLDLSIAKRPRAVLMATHPAMEKPVSPVAGPTRPNLASSRGSFSGSASQTRHMTKNPTVTLHHQTTLNKEIDELTHGMGEVDPARLEIQEELVQDLVVTPEVVLTLLAQLESALVDWFRNQAPETLKGRLTQDEFNDTIQALVTEEHIKFMITLLNFMHEEFLRGSPCFPHHLETRININRDMQRSRTSNRSSFKFSGANKGAAPDKVLNLQKYDLGYGIFVQRKVQDLREKQAADAAAAAATKEAKDAEALAMLGPGMHHPHGGGGSPLQQHGKSGSPTEHHHPQGHESPHHFGQHSGGHDHSSGHHGHDHSSSAGHHEHDHRGHGGSPSSSRPHQHDGQHGTRRSPSPEQGGHGQGEGGNKSPTPPGKVSFMIGGHGPGAHLHGGHQQHLAEHGKASPDHHHHHHHDGLHKRPPSLLVPHSPQGTGQAGLLQTPVSTRVHKAMSRTSSIMGAVSTARMVHANLGAQELNELQADRLLVLQQQFAQTYRRWRQIRAGMFFTMPVIFLSMRLLVNVLFTSLYPLWTKTGEGVDALEDMDCTLVQLFDPHGYLQSNLSLLQSTPDAVTVMTKHPQKSHTSQRAHFNDTSPGLAAALGGQPASAGARRLLQNAPRPTKLKTGLNSKQRDQLFQDVNQARCQGQDPNLASIGEPIIEPRDSWQQQYY